MVIQENQVKQESPAKEDFLGRTVQLVHLVETESQGNQEGQDCPAK